MLLGVLDLNYNGLTDVLIPTKYFTSPYTEKLSKQFQMGLLARALIALSYENLCRVNVSQRWQDSLLISNFFSLHSLLEKNI